MKLTRSLYFSDFIATPFVIIVLSALALTHVDPGLGSFLLWVLAFAGGCAAWTLVEYAVHRWIYHRVSMFKKFHEAHHARPRELIGVPPFISIGVIMAVTFVPLLGFSLLFASGITSGMLLGYMGYIILHHANHHWEPEAGSLLQEARIRHMMHHYHGAAGNYGVTTSFWDRVLDTYVESGGRMRLSLAAAVHQNAQSGRSFSHHRNVD